MGELTSLAKNARVSDRKGQEWSYRAIAQLVSVQVWGTWGPRFESGLPDFRHIESVFTFDMNIKIFQTVGRAFRSPFSPRFCPFAVSKHTTVVPQEKRVKRMSLLYFSFLLENQYGHRCCVWKEKTPSNLKWSMA